MIGLGERLTRRSIGRGPFGDTVSGDRPDRVRVVEVQPSPPAATPLDLVVLCDLRLPGGTSSGLAEEVRAASRAGYRVGAVQLDVPRLRQARPVHRSLAELIDDGSLVLLVPGEPVTARLTVIRHPQVLVEPLGAPLPVATGRVVMACGQVPWYRPGSWLYDPVEVHRNAVEALGQEPVWWPVTDVVRARLDGVPLADEDWVEVIDLDAWPMCDRSPPPNDAPLVIGRHGRDEPMKWPGTVEELLTVYPADDPGVRVEVLGGADSAVALARTDPTDGASWRSPWVVHPYGSVPVTEFLGGLDVFVYVPHADLVEAFGRTILEALASGLPAVLSPAAAGAFGEVCEVATPAEVPAVLERLRREPPAAWAQRAALGRQVVEERHSHAAFVDRLERLIGPPAELAAGRAGARWDLVPPRCRRERPVVLVVALGIDPDDAIRAVEALAEQRRRRAGFHPVLVITGQVPPNAADLGIECVVVRGRRRHPGPQPWEDWAAIKLRRLVVDHDAESVVVWDLSHPDAWIALGVRTRAPLPMPDRPDPVTSDRTDRDDRPDPTTRRAGLDGVHDPDEAGR